MNYKRWTLSILGLMALITGVLILFSSATHPGKQLKEPLLSDGFMEDVTVIKMNEAGTPETMLYSPKLTHFSDKNVTQIATPHFVFVPITGSPWHIYAQHGISSQGIEQINLWQDVKIYRAPSDDNKETTILTPALTLHPQNKTATTQEAVTLKQPGSLVKSKGLNANLETNTIELLSRSKVIYDTKQP